MTNVRLIWSFGERPRRNSSQPHTADNRTTRFASPSSATSELTNTSLVLTEAGDDIVELHHDVSSNLVLEFDGVFRGEHHCFAWTVASGEEGGEKGSGRDSQHPESDVNNKYSPIANRRRARFHGIQVQKRIERPTCVWVAEFDAVLVDGGEIQKADHLEAAGVGQQVPLPILEIMETAQFRNPVGSGSTACCGAGRRRQHPQSKSNRNGGGVGIWAGQGRGTGDPTGNTHPGDTYCLRKSDNPGSSWPGGFPPPPRPTVPPPPHAHPPLHPDFGSPPERATAVNEKFQNNQTMSENKPLKRDRYNNDDRQKWLRELLRTSEGKNWEGRSPLMLAWVPTGMNTGVSTRPCGSRSQPVRARPQLAVNRNSKGCGELAKLPPGTAPTAS